MALLVVANGFFVAAEFALVAARRSQHRGNWPRKATRPQSWPRNLIRHLDAYIAACQLGITIASLALGWIGEPALAWRDRAAAAPARRPICSGHGPRGGHRRSRSRSSRRSTSCWESWHRRGLPYSGQKALRSWIARPLHLFYMALRWPIAGLNAVGNARVAHDGPAGRRRSSTGRTVRRSCGSWSTPASRPGWSRSRKRGSPDVPSPSAISTRASLMTPRMAIQAVPVTAGLDDVLSRFTAGRHYRLLVYGASLDDILGAIHLRDLIRQGRGAPFALPSARSAGPHHPPRVERRMTCSKTCGGWGATWRWSSMSTAAPPGIITLADLLRALVGEIEEKGEQDASTSDLPRTRAGRDRPRGWVDATPRIRGDARRGDRRPRSGGGHNARRTHHDEARPAALRVSTKFRSPAGGSAWSGSMVGGSGSRGSFRQTAITLPTARALRDGRCPATSALPPTVRPRQAGWQRTPMAPAAMTLVASFPISSRRAEARR